MLASDQPALALFDIFKAHRCESVLNVTVNSLFKAAMKGHFSRWHSTKVKEALEQGQEIANVKVDL